MLALLRQVAAGERGPLLAGTAEYIGREGELVDALLGALRASIVAAYCGADSPLVEGDGAVLAAFAKELGASRCEAWLSELLRTKERMRLTPGLEDIVLESSLLELARAEVPADFGELLERLGGLEARLGGGGRSGGGGGGSGAPPAPARPSGVDRGAGSTPAPPTQAAPPAPPAAAPSAAPSAEAPADTPARASAPVQHAPVEPAPPPAPARAAAQAATPPPAPAPVPEPAPRPEPAPEPQVELAPAPARAADPSELFAAAVADLERTRPSFAELLRRGRVTVTGARVEVALRTLDDADQHLLADARSMGLARTAVEKAFGAGVELAIIHDDGRGEPPPPPDAFTAQVVDLFKGRIEDAPQHRR